MLPDTSWLVRFAYRDGNVETYERNTFGEAMSMYDLFDESDADIYTEIRLIKRDWSKDENNCDTVIGRKVFG